MAVPASASSSSSAAVQPDAPDAAHEPARDRRWRLSRSRKLTAGLLIVGFFALLATVGAAFASGATTIGDDVLLAPSAGHWLGTTDTGQDVFKLLLLGSRGSLLIGVVAASAAVAVSTVIGVVGGYLGGAADEFLSLLTNVVLVLPGLPLVIMITDYVGNRSLLVIALVIAFTTWAAPARVLRSQVLSLRSRDYVAAAKVSGERTWRIMAFEILPNLIPIIASQFVFGLVLAILTDAGLAFLGLGNLDGRTWGSMLYFAQNGQALQLGAWWWFVPPGACIALVGTGLSLINFGLDELLNPRLRTWKGARS
jgi:peptide/nickel transport system permease protein